ncbi:MAG TPA: chemotaxis protein CheW [Spirochaetota bacterium]|jgi:purine-binding chemotaxis protein CheW|nr:purine-binding chemotaxis protein CheW [Spirochaetota bacterium]OQA98936.1 MAG: Chemotaxis protein CheW [Spirochaetes bacterium ADurb.Bin218]HOK03270.1 chemotaxis protein CheW [Spirochaetota bacterium]HOK92413.1 chemotaxis protein CheW [Spirochaetota bacterium]HON16968.1 chemotaxis protein CheW [Spirochaetota bacterium]
MHQKTQEVINSIQIVCFKIGNEEYGIDILQVQEILKIPKVTKLPKSSNHVLGVIDLRGRVIPIIDLGKKFGIVSNLSQASRAIVVNIEGKQIGLAIDSVSHVVKVDSTEIEPPPPVVKGISGKYIVGIAKLKTGFVVILDINQIFSSEEIKSL